MSSLKRLIVPAVALLAVFVVTQVLAEPKEGAAAANMGESATSSMRVQTLQPMTMLQTTIRTTFEKMDVVGPIIEELEKVVLEKHINAAGMIVFAYVGATQDPAKEFELTIGIPVHGDVKAFDKWEVKEHPAYKCATVLHSGHLRSMGGAYQKLFAEVGEKGLIPNGTTREFYMYWEGEDSDNNVVLIQAGLQ